MEARGEPKEVGMSGKLEPPPKVHTDRPGKMARVMIWDDDKPEQV